jgi:hypothetical protein
MTLNIHESRRRQNRKGDSAVEREDYVPTTASSATLMCCFTRMSLMVISECAAASLSFTAASFSLHAFSFSACTASAAPSASTICSSPIRTWSCSILATSCQPIQRLFHYVGTPQGKGLGHQKHVKETNEHDNFFSYCVSPREFRLQA